MGHMSSGAVDGTTAARQGTPRQPKAFRPLRVAAVALAIPFSLVALGCRGAITPTPTPTQNPDFASIEASPTPGSAEVFKASGKGDKVTESFNATGLSVDVKFDYTCTPESSFTINFYGAGASPELPDVLVDEYGAGRSDTVNEALNNSTGPFHLEITTQCSWSVEVLGSK